MRRLLSTLLLLVCAVAASGEECQPNVVLMFLDNVGYGDLGETRNLADQQPALVRELTAKLDRWLEDAAADN
jgi:hypothetical protein